MTLLSISARFRPAETRTPVRKKGVLAFGQNGQKEESENHQNYRFVTITTDAQLQPRGFTTQLTTIHSYKEGSLARARESKQARESRSCNPFNSTESRVQCFQQDS